MLKMLKLAALGIAMSSTAAFAADGRDRLLRAWCLLRHGLLLIALPISA